MILQYKEKIKMISVLLLKPYHSETDFSKLRVFCFKTKKKFKQENMFF